MLALLVLLCFSLSDLCDGSDIFPTEENTESDHFEKEAQDCTKH